MASGNVDSHGVRHDFRNGWFPWQTEASESAPPASGLVYAGWMDVLYHPQEKTHMCAPPVYKLEELEAAAAEILGEELATFGRKADGSPHWGDVLNYCAKVCFVTMRPEDRSTEIVRHAVGLLDEDLELAWPPAQEAVSVAGEVTVPSGQASE
jgi:hypothetical protein